MNTTPTLRSIVDMTISNNIRVDLECSGVFIGIGLQVSDDDTDNDSVPIVMPSAMQLFLPFETLTKGKDEIKALLHSTLESTRSVYATSGVAKLMGHLDDFVDNRDFTEYAKLHIPFPESLTRH